MFQVDITTCTIQNEQSISYIHMLSFQKYKMKCTVSYELQINMNVR